MPTRYYANAPATTLAASVTIAGTSIQVVSVAGLPIQYPYTLILDRGTATEEAVSVTAASGTTLTITRAIDGTTAFAHNAGGAVEHGITAQDVRESNTHINASTAVHGIAGAVVGTSDTQALTNKDLTSGTNLFPASLATDAELNTHAATGAHIPIGGWVGYGGDTDPDSNWLICDGRALSRTTYSVLFGRYGTKYGAGDGSTTFNIPDFRDKFQLGSSASRASGTTGGSSTKTLTTANLPSHLHSMAHTHAIDHDHASFNTPSGGSHSHQTLSSDTDGPNQSTVRTGVSAGGVQVTTQIQGVNSDHTHSIDVPAFTGTSGASSAANTGSTGSGTAFDIMPPNLAGNFIVRVL